MKTLNHWFKAIFENNKNSSIFLFLALCFQVVYFLFSEGKDFLYSDGWYYANTARSILAGEGFSNPFSVETGPTAWIPPLYTLIFIPVFKLLGDNFSSYMVLLFIQLAGLTLSFYLITKIWSLLKLSKSNFVPFILFLFLIFSYKIHFIRMINDLWIYMLLFSVQVYAFYTYIYGSGKAILLFILAAVIPLSAPVLAPGYVAILTIFFIWGILEKYGFKQKSLALQPRKVRLFHIILCGIIFSAAVSIWAYRNYKVFDQVVLSKSNEWFEFYLSNVKDDDGVLSESTVEKYHPDNNRAQYAADILAKGEVVWMDEYEKISAQYTSEHRSDYYRKILNRAFNVFVFTEFDYDLVNTDVLQKLDTEYRQKIIDQKLIRDNKWVNMDSRADIVENTLKAILPNNYSIVYDNWKTSKNMWLRAKYSIKYTVLGITIALIPMLCLLYLLIYFRKTERNLVYLLTILYITYVIPYILISHQIRYQEPLFGLQVLIISIAVTVFIKKTSIIKPFLP